MSFINKRRVAYSPGGSSKAVLTAKDFLGKTGKPAYLEAGELINFVDNGRIGDIQSMETFFSLVKENLRMVINRRTLIDAGGTNYKWENFIRAKGQEGTKVVSIGKMQQFTTDYQQGKFTIDFTFEELVAEAEKE